MNKNLVIGLVILCLVLAITGFLLIQIGTKTNNNLGINNKNNQQTDTNNQETGSNNNANNYNVEIKNFAFSPSSLTIKKGDKVTWINQDSARHTVTSDSGNELNSALLSQGQSYSQTFNTPGTYNYHCTPHPYMKAKIIVE